MSVLSNALKRSFGFLSIASAFLTFGLFGLPATAQPVTTQYVGYGVDFFLESQSPILSATGSFDKVTGVTSEMTGQTADLFSLQLNTNDFDAPACKNSPNMNAAKPCVGWQQFVFVNKNYTGDCGQPFGDIQTCVFIQYWLWNYGDPCPQGFGHQGGSTVNCFQNGAQAPVPEQTIANLGKMKLTGQVNAGGQDNVTLWIGSTPYPGTGAPDSILSLGQGGYWTQAEFNVVGGCCSLEAELNPSSTIVVRLAVDNGTTAAPSCSRYAQKGGDTAESNNLTLLSPCCPFAGSNPAIDFAESNVTGSPATCTPPEVTITASPNPVPMGQSTQLSWTSSNTVNCTPANDWLGGNPTPPLAPNGGLSVNPPITSTPRPIQTFDYYAITCANAGGSSKPTQVVVAVDPPFQRPVEIAACNLVCFRSLYGDPTGQGENPVKADVLLERMDKAAGKLGPFAPFGEAQSKIKGPTLLLQSGAIESLQISGSRQPGTAGQAAVTVTLSPGSKVIKLGELGADVRIAEAAAESTKRPTSAESLASAKPRIIGINFNAGTLSGLLIAREVSPPEASRAK